MDEMSATRKIVGVSVLAAPPRPPIVIGNVVVDFQEEEEAASTLNCVYRVSVAVDGKDAQKDKSPTHLARKGWSR